MAAHDHLSPDDLKTVRGLSVLARGVVEGFVTGQHRSPHQGFSVEFKQHRPYTPGDEIRKIDWKAFGRSDKLFLREYEEETNLRAHLALDCSGSMGYTGTGGVRKIDYARGLAACLAHIYISQQDGVGLTTFDTAPRDIIPNRSRTNHLGVILGALAKCETGGETSIGDTLHKIAAKIPRRGMVILISDLFGDVDEIGAVLTLLRGRRQEVVVFQVWDRDELDFQFKGPTKFKCMEVEEHEHLVEPTSLRKSYLAALENYRHDLSRVCSKNRIDLVETVTDRPYADTLRAYLAMREGRGGKRRAIATTHGKGVHP